MAFVLIIAMNNSRLIFYIVVLIFISTESEGNADDIIDHCKFTGDMCDLDDACFKMLWDIDHRNDGCTIRSSQPPRLLGVEQSMSFEPSWSDKYYYIVENYTYSVYMSNDGLRNDVNRVPGCCNLDNKKNDTCRMPAISDPKIKFIVVFPFRENTGKSAIYCNLLVEYANLPLNFCVEGEEVVDPCLEVSEDGDVEMKYRYTPLSGDTKSSKIETNRCYFPLSSEVMPNNATYPTREFTPNKNGFIRMKPPKSAIVRNVTEHNCTIHKKVNASDHFEIATDIYNEGGDFVCCGIKSLNNDSIYYQETFCTNMQLSTPSATPLVLPIVIPISAFVALLALVACVQVCRTHDKFKNMADDWKKSPSLRFLMKHHEDVKHNEQPTVGEVPKKEEFYEVVPETEDETSGIERNTSISHLSISSEKQHDDRDQDEAPIFESTNGGGVYIMKGISPKKEKIDFDESRDSGFSHGSGSDLGQYCKKSYDENCSEPTYPNSAGDSGYLAKTLTSGTPNVGQDHDTAESTLKADATLHDVNV